VIRARSWLQPAHAVLSAGQSLQTSDKVQIVRRFDASPTMPQWWRRGLSSPVNEEEGDPWCTSMTDGKRLSRNSLFSMLRQLEFRESPRLDVIENELSLSEIQNRLMSPRESVDSRSDLCGLICMLSSGHSDHGRIAKLKSSSVDVGSTRCGAPPAAPGKMIRNGERLTHLRPYSPLLHRQAGAS
jgi:hypothetical protein